MALYSTRTGERIKLENRFIEEHAKYAGTKSLNTAPTPASGVTVGPRVSAASPVEQTARSLEANTRRGVSASNTGGTPTTAQLRNQARQAAADLDTDTLNRVNARLKERRAAAGEQTAGDRANDIATAIFAGSGAGVTNTVGTMANAFNDPESKRRQISSLQKRLADGGYSDGKRFHRDTEEGRKTIRDSIRRLADEAWKLEQEDSFTNRTQAAADRMQDDSAEAQERAKEGLGAVGSTLVDAGISTGQSMLDAGIGALTGTGMAPFVVRAFGGAAQEARRGGADLDQQLGYGTAQAAKEYVTEKLFGLAVPQRISGSRSFGSVDDAIEKGIRNVTERLAKTPAGQQAIGGILTWLAGGATEGLEEGIGSVIENTLINPNLREWDPDTRTGQEKFEDALYDMLVGGVSGLMGVTNLFTYDASAGGIAGQAAPVLPAQTEASAASAADTEGREILMRAALDMAQGEQAAGFDRERAMNASEEAGTPTETTAADSRVPLRTEAREAAAPQPQASQRAAKAAQERTPAEIDYDIQRVRQASSAFGESGAKALMAAYDGQSDAGTFYGGFSAYYQAGLSGADTARTDHRYGSTLTDAQKYAAYTAGQNDARVSLARERQAAKYAQMAGTDSGLVYDDFVREAVESGRTRDDVNNETRAYLDAGTAEKINRIAKDLGVRVRFVDAVRGGTANAQISGSEILVERNNENPVVAVIGHEMTHRMQRLAPEQYRQFRDLVTRDLDYMVQRRIEDYARQGVELSIEDAMDEVTADYAGLLMDDGQVLDDFIRRSREDRTLLEKIRDVIRAIARKLTGKEKKQALNAEQKLTEALGETLDAARRAAARQGRKNSAALESSGATDRTTVAPRARYSYGGRNADRADSVSLARAEKLESQGENIETIRQETGWFRGMDGQWRFEIDDSGMEYSRWGDMKRADRAEYARFRELEGKFIDGSLTAEEQRELRNLIDQGHGAGRAEEQGVLRLSDFIRHDELFENYPQLRKAGLRFEELPKGVRGAFDGRDIVLSESLRSAPEDTLIHEIQHAIQRAEGFARGATWEYWNRRLEEGYVPPQEKVRSERIEAAMQTIREIEATAPEGFLSRLREYQYLEDYIASEAGTEDMDAWERAEAVRTELEERYSGLFQKWFDADWERQMAEGSRSESMPSDLYRNTAGEIEARDVAARRKLSPEERRRTPPDLGNENTVFSEDGTYGYTMSADERASVKEQLKDGQSILDSMEPVAEISRNDLKGLTTNQARLKLTEELKKTGYKVDRPNFGVIQFTEKEINNSLNYKERNASEEDARRTAMLALPQVLKHGKEISGHRNHKARGYGTVTIAAPVVINGKRGNMAVVVRETKGNRYKIHRILTPDGGAFTLKKMDSAERYPVGGITDAVQASGEVAPANFLRAENILSQHEQESNGPDDKKFRHSLKAGTVNKTYEALLRENELLRDSVDYWETQTKRTRRITTDKKAVEKAAEQLIKTYGADIDVSEIYPELQSLYDYISSGRDGKDELTYTEARRRANEIAEKLAENAIETAGGINSDYMEVRQYLRTARFVVSDEIRQSITDYGDFRKRNFGRLNLVKGDMTNIDQLYEEMSENWPGLFDSQRESNPVDQLLHIAEVAEDLQRTQGWNPFSGYMSNAITDISNDILDRFFSLPQTKATFADRQALKLQESIAMVRNQNRENTKKAIQREREVRDRQLKRLKDHYAQVRRSRADSAARTRLLKIAKRLQNKKLPAVSRALLDQYIGDLDTTAKSMTGKTLERLTDLRDWYSEQRETDPDFISDPTVERDLERLSKRNISDLTSEEVADLTRVLLNIENELRTKNKLIDSKERKDIYMQGLQVIGDVERSGGSQDGLAGAFDKYIVTETLSPVRQIKRMAGYVKEDPLVTLVNELADGQRESIAYQMEAEKKFRKWTENKRFRDGFSGVGAKPITITGLVSGKGMTTVEITPAMRAALYLHSLNDQNLRHIMEGGITVPDMKLYRRGKLAEAYARGTTVKLTPSQVRSIAADMTGEERAFARAAHDYFNGQSRDRINEVSEKLKGYSIAQVEDYFPINTDSSFTRSDFETLKFDGTLEGMGFLKDRQTKAANPILLRDLNDVLEKSIDQHSRYVGLAIPVRNFNKVWGVTKSSFNDDGSRNSFESSVQKAVKNAWGESGYNYIEKLMTDLQSGSGGKNVWTKLLNRVRSNYAGAVLTLNASVAMKQAASYPTAAAVLGWKPLVRAMGDVGKVDLDLIARYTPLQWYRSKGFSTKELGDLRKGGGYVANAMNSLPPVLNWVQGADLITTRKLWKASEYYVRDHNRNLSVGTDAYYRAVAEVYNRVIEETQPNYTTMQRPQLLRSDDSLLGNLAMFKTQPFQNFNILYDAIGEYAAEKRRGGNMKAARENLNNAVTSQIAQLAVFAGMTMAWAMFRGKPDKYEDEDGEMTLLSVLKAIGKDMVGGALSGVPFGSDVWEMLSSKLFGDKYYGMDAVTVTALTDTIASLNGMGELIGTTIKSVVNGEDISWSSARIKLDRYLDDISKAAGAPYENVVNLFNAFYRYACTATLGKYKGGYAAMKLTADPEKDSRGYYDLLYQAMEKDMRAYDEIYRDMVGSGNFEEDKIRSAMEKRMKEDQGVEHAEDLSRRYLSPEQERTYSGMKQQVSDSAIWRNATEAQRKSVEEDLYNISVGNRAGETLAEKISGGAAYGIDDADYILYRLALHVVDQPTKSGKFGSYTNEEVEAAIDMLPGLSDRARGYLWNAQGKNEKSNPYH